MAGGSTDSDVHDADDAMTVGGEPVVTLAVSSPDGGDAFIAAQVLPGCGMMILQITARLVARGETTLLASPPLARARELLESGKDTDSAAMRFPVNTEFSMGDAILVPYANRIRGTLSPDAATITTAVAGREVMLPANWSGKAPGAERYAMHGLLLGARIHGVTRERTPDRDTVRATYDAGDFGGHWPSRTRLAFEYTLTPRRFSIGVRATNAGTEPLPMGIGSHPYFRIPSGDRAQAQLHIPARLRALVDNYDAVLPTGVLEPVRGTRYDFTAPDGRTLGDEYLDDCFTDLERSADGTVVCSIADPAAGFGLRVIGESPAISAVQVYAPPNEAYVALEPQFNLADPFGAEWAPAVNTGMVLLAPGASVEYRVALELFRP